MKDLALDLQELERLNLSQALDFVSKFENAKNNDSVTLNISFLRNTTLEGISPFLKYHHFCSNLIPQISFGNFDTIYQEIIDDTSHLYTTSPDIIVLSITLERFDPTYPSIQWSSDQTWATLKEWYETLALKTSALIIVNTFIPPFSSEFGITQQQVYPDKIVEVTALNQQIRSFVRQNSKKFFLVDLERLIRITGEEVGIDYRFYYLSKAPYSRQLLNLYALEIAKISRALKGKTKKCLILDCDNTLWGGIVGESGVDGIKLSTDGFPGKVFYDFQRTLLSLHERGVILALCSKNNEADVWEVLDSHPACLLKRSHIAAHRINWNNKAVNIAELASELNIGLDSFVFLDDSFTECALIRSMLPAVTVVQVPERLSSYPNLIIRSGLFDTLAIGKEDRERTQMYQAEGKRKNEEKRYSNIQEFLTSLELVAVIHEAKKDEIPRIAQLTQKTNQFNLTTRRYSDSQIQQMAEAPHSSVYSLSVYDKFGDYGLTGALILLNENNIGIVDTLLLSCRILGRHLEFTFVERCLDLFASTHPISGWEADFIPTAKNQQVEFFWKTIGFTTMNRSESYVRYTGAVRGRPKMDQSFITVKE